MTTRIEVDAAQKPDQAIWDLDGRRQPRPDGMGLNPAHDCGRLQLLEERIVFAHGEQLLPRGTVATPKNCIEERQRPLLEEAEERRIKRIEPYAKCSIRAVARDRSRIGHSKSFRALPTSRAHSTRSFKARHIAGRSSMRASRGRTAA